MYFIPSWRGVGHVGTGAERPDGRRAHHGTHGLPAAHIGGQAGLRVSSPA